MIEVVKLSVQSGAFNLHEANLFVPRGAYGVLMGRTGSGKSTLLEAIAGLRTVTSGTVRLAGRDVSRLKPALRGVGFVPQDGALFATMTAREHLAFALRIRRAPKEWIAQRVAELAALLDIEPLLDRRPHTFSGGERQRVALGRALSYCPDVLLLDEPLSAVDEETREDMYALLLTVKHETGATMLHVTHHQEEARRLADVLFRIEDGAVVEKG